jgi:hypothetical protein
MGDKELRVGALELHRLSLGCIQCKSEVIFEAHADRGPGGLMCPNCGVPMPNAVHLVTAYRDFLRMCAAEKNALSVSFLVKLDD